MPPMTDSVTLAPIDLPHLKQMTMGDGVLAREVLTLFDRQLSIMMKRMTAADSRAKGEVAHALKGSARGIGAWRVADAAALAEVAGDAVTLRDLEDAIAEVRADIARLLKRDALF
jgi:hypothetical protein